MDMDTGTEEALVEGSGGCRDTGGRAQESPSLGQPEDCGPHGVLGLCLTMLGTYPANTMVDERALAECLATSPRTVRRMVHCGQIPQGIKLGCRRMWITGKVLEFLLERADTLAADAKQVARRMRVNGV